MNHEERSLAFTGCKPMAVYRDALDAYSKAIRLNPYISEVWYDLGTLYETCNNQVQDALDAYQRAADLDPSNPRIKQRLDILKRPPQSGTTTSAPVPQDVVNPSQYNNTSSSLSGSALPFDQVRRSIYMKPYFFLIIHSLFFFCISNQVVVKSHWKTEILSLIHI